LSYTSTNWRDHLVQYSNRYTFVDNGDGTYTITPAPGTVTQEGTPLSAAKMNNIEQGITAHLADLVPHGVLDYSTELTRNNGVLTSVIEYIFGVKRAETTLTRTDGKLTSVNVKKYADDGVTVTEEFTDTLTRTDGKLTSVTRVVS